MKEVTAAIILKDNKVLIARRAPDIWEILGDGWKGKWKARRKRQIRVKFYINKLGVGIICDILWGTVVFAIINSKYKGSSC